MMKTRLENTLENRLENTLENTLENSLTRHSTHEHEYDCDEEIMATLHTLIRREDDFPTYRCLSTLI